MEQRKVVSYQREQTRRMQRLVELMAVPPEALKSAQEALAKAHERLEAAEARLKSEQPQEAMIPK
jgi:hypothetical protein